MGLHSNATSHLFWPKPFLALPQGLDNHDGILTLDVRKRIICIFTTLLTGLLCLVRGSTKQHYCHCALHL